MSAELKKKVVECYTPSEEVQDYLGQCSVEELAFVLPNLRVFKV